MKRVNLKNIKRFAGKTWQFIHYVFVRFINDDGFYRASALTFTTLLAIVPLMFVMISILSAFPVSQQLDQEIQDFIFANFVPTTGESIKVYLLEFVQKAGNLSWLGILFLVVTAVLMLFTIEQAFNHIWHVKRRRHGIATFMLYWAILTLSPILLGISFAISTYLLSLPEVTNAAAWLGITEILLSAMVFVLVWLVFAIIYITIPNCQVPVRHGFIGGLVSAVLYEIVRNGFVFYISHFSTYQLIYGALAVIPVFLLWVYLLWLIILFGAVLTQCLTFRYTIIGQRKLKPFIHAVQWLGYLWQAQKSGKSLSLLDFVRRDRCQYTVSPEQQIEVLQEAGFVIRTKQGRFVLGVDINDYTLLTIYHRLPWKLPTPNEDFKSAFWVATFQEHLEALDKNIAGFLDSQLPEFIR